MSDHSTDRGATGRTIPWQAFTLASGVIWLLSLIAAIVWFANAQNGNQDQAEFSDHVIEQMVNYCSTSDTVDGAACTAFWAAIDSAPTGGE